jgi:pilus assembly protein Flp/PilA
MIPIGGEREHPPPREQGQGMVEYALILALIAVAVIAILTLVGDQVATFFQEMVDTLVSV